MKKESKHYRNFLMTNLSNLRSPFYNRIQEYTYYSKIILVNILTLLEILKRSFSKDKLNFKSSKKIKIIQLILKVFREGY